MDVENFVLSWKNIAIYLVVAKNAFCAVSKNHAKVLNAIFAIQVISVSFNIKSPEN